MSEVTVSVSDKTTGKTVIVETGIGLEELTSDLDKIDAVANLLERIANGDYIHLSDLAEMESNDLERLAEEAALNGVEAQDAFDMEGGDTDNRYDDSDSHHNLRSYHKMATRDKATVD
ncbi:hypothetical protein GX865_03410 [Candidatus Saccharibacteria bacterium]|jgi:hypothetical protein|nr:hypothetical protein [Candidatus Saccharibacteria bacterium]